MPLIKNIKPKDLAPGLTGYYAHGDKMTLGYLEIKAGSHLPAHSHPHEQITYIIEGQLDMIINGTAHSLAAGSYHVIPSNTVHSAVAASDCKLIDAFAPIREDYKQ